MGQRSQIYIKMENIGKAWAKKVELNNSKAWKNKIPEYVEACEAYEKWKVLFGEGDTIIVAFHNQWLYGRTFPVVASMLLYASKVFNKDEYKRYFSSNFWSEDRYVETKNVNMNNPLTLIQWLESYMSNLMDQELGPYTRSGFERFIFLNEEHEAPNVAYRYDKDFTIGDNNDGVLIVDMSETKYCFININSYDNQCINDNFPYMKPVSALKYIKHYYPECFEDLAEGETETPEKLSENCEINTKFAQRFNQYEVLTAEELINMFPKLKVELEKSNTSPVEKKKAKKKKV